LKVFSDLVSNICPYIFLILKGCILEKFSLLIPKKCPYFDLHPCFFILMPKVSISGVTELKELLQVN